MMFPRYILGAMPGQDDQVVASLVVPAPLPGREQDVAAEFGKAFSAFLGKVQQLDASRDVSGLDGVMMATSEDPDGYKVLVPDGTARPWVVAAALAALHAAHVNVAGGAAATLPLSSITAAQPVNGADVSTWFGQLT